MWKLLPHLFVFANLLLRSNASFKSTIIPKEINWNLANNLEHSTILFPLTTLSNPNIVSKTCDMQMQKLRRGVLERKPWALKILDATGSKLPAFMFGDNFWLGSHELCNAARSDLNLEISLYVEHKMNISLLSTKSPFDVRYRVVYLEHNSPYQVDVVYGQFQPILHIGLCLPADCNTQEVMQLVSAYFESVFVLNNDLYDLNAHVLDAKPIEFKAEHYYKLISFQLLVIFSIYTLLITFCAYRLRRRQIESTSSNAAAAATNIYKDINVSSKEKSTNSQTSLEAFILCYDIELNWFKIFTTPESSSTNPFAFLNGGRVVSALITTYYHTFILLSAIASNVPQLFVYVSNIGNLDVAMDVFLLVSGFLQTYNFLKNKIQIENIRQYSITQNFMEIMKTIFHRFLRLAPLYYFTICLSYLMLHYLGNTTVFHTAGVFAEKCEQYWWRNVLFIHNLFNYKDICLIWTWHLSCEMQYSIALALLLVTYAKHPTFAKIIILLVIIGSLTYQTIMGLHLNYQISLESTFAHFTQLYMHPLSRIFPYLGGAITCWLYLEYNSKLRSCKIFNNFFSHLIYLVFTICTQAAPFGRAYTVRMATFILILQRCCYSLSGCWSILVMANKHLDWYCRILSAKVFQKAFHFSYALSLLNSVLILYIYSYNNKVVYAEPIRMAVLYIGLIIIVYILSLPLTLLFEMPYRNISNLLIKRNVVKKLKHR